MLTQVHTVIKAKRGYNKYYETLNFIISKILIYIKFVGNYVVCKENYCIDVKTNAN